MGGRVFNVVNFDHKSNTNMTVYPGMSEWLLFNAIKWEIVQLHVYDGENKLHFGERKMMMMSALY